MSPKIPHSEVADLAAKAEAFIAESDITRTWADLFPVVEKFTTTSGKLAITSAVQFLINERIIDESQRVAAAKAFRDEYRKRKKETTSDEANASTFFTK